MSWFWGSSKTSPPTDTPSSSPPESRSQSQPSSQPHLQPQPQSQHHPLKSTRPDLLKSLDTSEAPDAALEELKASLFPTTTTTTTTPDQATTTSSTFTQPSPSSDPDFYTLSTHPSRLRCTQAFDQAFFCSSMGGQLRNVYMYGGLRMCGDAWAEWRLCMRAKAMGEEEKMMRIREWNRDKYARYKTGPSSEDVWEMRRGDIPEGFFGDPGDVVDVRDLEQK